MMDKRIGTYQDGVRVLPELTLTGKPVRRPVHTTRDIGNNQFVVLDDALPGNFDIDAAIEKLTGGAFVSSTDPLVFNTLSSEPASPNVFGSFASDTPSDTVSEKRTK